MFWLLLIELCFTMPAYAFFIKYFKRRKIVQYVRREGPQLHNYKEGTPTAGGVVFIVMFLLFYSISLFFGPSRFYLELILTVILFGGIGFLDDYLSYKNRNSEGLDAKQKLLLQIGASLILYFLALSRGHIPDNNIELYNLTFNLSWFYPIFFVLLLTGFSNATNLTDGLDGLAGGTALITAAGAQIVLWLSGIYDYSMMFLAGALLGFLWFNIKPASIFMGDTGALALGGIFGMLALMSGQLIPFILLSTVFLMELLSVVIQVSSYKITGKRVFKMSPIHHHFELLGWTETTVVVRFWLINSVGVVFAIVSVII